MVAFDDLNDIKKVWVFIEALNEFVKCKVEKKELVSCDEKFIQYIYELKGTAKKFYVFVEVKYQIDIENLQIKKA